jgi:hypothetical protein
VSEQSFSFIAFEIVSFYFLLPHEEGRIFLASVEINDAENILLHFLHGGVCFRGRSETFVCVRSCSASCCANGVSEIKIIVSVLKFPSSSHSSRILVCVDFCAAAVEQSLSH